MSEREDARRRIRAFLDAWATGHFNCEHIHGFNGHVLYTHDIETVLKETQDD